MHGVCIADYEKGDALSKINVRKLSVSRSVSHVTCRKSNSELILIPFCNKQSFFLIKYYVRVTTIIINMQACLSQLRLSIMKAFALQYQPIYCL